ncbi:MAG: LysM peptidoglycan-binding domain-containing protein [Bacteroidia bacterium]
MQHLKSIGIIAFLLLSVSAMALTDSTGLKIMSNNKVFIVHQVEKGQGLYSISKRYKVSVPDIEVYNPDVKTAGIKVDQYIFIPTNIAKADAEKLIADADKKKKAKENGTIGPKNKDDNVVWYTVKAGETLFSISRLDQCKFTIDEIKRWNSLKTNSLSEGQKIIIAFRDKVKVKDDPVTVDEIKDVVAGGEGEERKGDTTQVIWSDVTTTGLATYIPDPPSGEGKSLALYNNVEIGSIVRIENLANNKATYAKVIGPLAGNEKKDVVIVLTESASKRLDVSDKIFRVEIVYSNDQL